MQFWDFCSVFLSFLTFLITELFQNLSAKDEEKWLLLFQNGNEQEQQEAKDILIERNLRLVAHIVKKYPNYGKDSEDLISIGTIGLIKAVSTFKNGKGTRLATYAARCIENAIIT